MGELRPDPEHKHLGTIAEHADAHSMCCVPRGLRGSSESMTATITTPIHIIIIGIISSDGLAIQFLIHIWTHTCMQHIQPITETHHMRTPRSLTIFILRRLLAVVELLKRAMLASTPKHGQPSTPCKQIIKPSILRGLANQRWPSSTGTNKTLARCC